MEKKQKCSCKTHKETDAIAYCEQCKIFMCNKCLNYHNELFENHQKYNIDIKNNELFIDICKEVGHEKKLEFFCKDHNELCCAVCIVKLKDKGYGQHKDCEVCSIENIKEEKKNKLKQNLEFLQNLSNNLESTINELKTIFEKINKSKEELKVYVQKIFTKLRTDLNSREDELLLEIDKKFNEKFCKEDIMEESIKLPNKIKKSLEKGKFSDNDWNNQIKLSSLINDCINIEKNIKIINNLNKNIQNCKKFNDFKIKFLAEDSSVNHLIQSIKEFGKINISQFYLDDSLILKSEEDSIKFFELISKEININNMKLLYRYSKDGSEYNTLVNKLNNKSNLIFIYSTGNKRIFGNFFKTNLENLENLVNEKYYTDNKAFVFSLNNNKIYKVLRAEKALRIIKGNNSIFTGNTGNSNGFYISGKNINDNGLLNEPKVYDFENKNELTEGDKKLNEFEIFEIY